jgi:hypothetical protein
MIKNLGNLNCMTLLVPSGNRIMVIFLKIKSHSHYHYELTNCCNIFIKSYADH